jgi:hypothetical protein
MTERVFRCARDTRCTTELRCYRKTMTYTHDEYRDMLLTNSAYNRQAGTRAREYTLRYPGRRHPDANVFRRLEQSA